MVGHLVLSWSKEDLSKLCDEIMVERAKEYMQKMGIGDKQFVVVTNVSSPLIKRSIPVEPSTTEIGLPSGK